MNYVIVVLSIIFYVQSIVPNNLEYFLQGNQAYQKGNYQEALETYQKINKKGAAVWYNMGFCCYKLDKSLQAKAYWRRAQKELNQHVYNQSKNAIDNLVDKKEEISFFQTIYNLLLLLSLRFSLWFWQIIILLIWLIMCIIISLTQGPMKRNSLAFCLFVIVFFINLMHIKHFYIQQDQGIVLHEGSLHIGPGEQFSTKDVLDAGSDVLVQDISNDWYKVTTAQKVGWLPRPSIIRIAELS